MITMKATMTIPPTLVNGMVSKSSNAWPTVDACDTVPSVAYPHTTLNY